jgi:hypothetical protein
VSGIIELAALARLAAFRERRFGNRKSMCPYKRPYNSGATRIRLLPSPSVMAALTCGKRPVGYCPAPSFPPLFRIPKPCAQVRILPGAPTESQFKGLKSFIHAAYIGASLAALFTHAVFRCQGRDFGAPRRLCPERRPQSTVRGRRGVPDAEDWLIAVFSSGVRPEPKTCSGHRGSYVRGIPSGAFQPQQSQAGGGRSPRL